MNRQLLGQVYAKSLGRCWYCGSELAPFSSWEVEHQIPRSKGGANDLSNLVAACRQCNSRKSNRDLSEYEDYLINELSRQIHTAMSFAAKLNGPDMGIVYNHLLEATRYLYDTHIVFWGEGRDPNEHSLCCGTSNETPEATEIPVVQ